MKNKKLHEAKNYIAKLLIEQPDIDGFQKSDTKTVSALANKFLDVSKRLRKNEYQGLQAAEIDEIDDFVDMILQAAMESNVTTIIKRLEGIIGKTLKGTETLPGQEDEMDLDIEDETI